MMLPFEYNKQRTVIVHQLMCGTLVFWTEIYCLEFHDVWLPIFFSNLFDHRFLTNPFMPRNENCMHQAFQFGCKQEEHKL